MMIKRVAEGFLGYRCARYRYFGCRAQRVTRGHNGAVISKALVLYILRGVVEILLKKGLVIVPLLAVFYTSI